MAHRILAIFNYFLLGLPYEILWGVNELNQVYYGEFNSGAKFRWTLIPGVLKQVEIGRLGVFGVTSDDNIYYRIGTHNNLDYPSYGTTWQR